MENCKSKDLLIANLIELEEEIETKENYTTKEIYSNVKITAYCAGCGFVERKKIPVDINNMDRFNICIEQMYKKLVSSIEKRIGHKLMVNLE